MASHLTSAADVDSNARAIEITLQLKRNNQYAH
jgi:hypothetical protein